MVIDTKAIFTTVFSMDKENLYGVMAAIMRLDICAVVITLIHPLNSKLDSALRNMILLSLL